MSSLKFYTFAARIHRRCRSMSGPTHVVNFRVREFVFFLGVKHHAVSIYEIHDGRTPEGRAKKPNNRFENPIIVTHCSGNTRVAVTNAAMCKYYRCRAASSSASSAATFCTGRKSGICTTTASRAVHAAYIRQCVHGRTVATAPSSAKKRSLCIVATPTVGMLCRQQTAPMRYRDQTLIRIHTHTHTRLQSQIARQHSSPQTPRTPPRAPQAQQAPARTARDPVCLWAATVAARKTTAATTTLRST